MAGAEATAHWTQLRASFGDWPGNGPGVRPRVQEWINPFTKGPLTMDKDWSPLTEVHEWSWNGQARGGWGAAIEWSGGGQAVDLPKNGLGAVWWTMTKATARVLLPVEGCVTGKYQALARHLPQTITGELAHLAGGLTVYPVGRQSERESWLRAWPSIRASLVCQVRLLVPR